MDARLRQTEAIVPQLVGALRHAIVALELKPGEALSEAEIAHRFGVSRQPVREAFIKLSEAGLVEIRPSRGTYVMKISVARVANARLVREAIECDIARHASRLATSRQISDLRDIIEAQRLASTSGDYWSFNEHDEAFHRTISIVVQCDYAGRIVEGARIQTDRVRFLSIPDASPLPMLIRQHEEILDSLADRDPVRAEASMRRHLREILRALPRIANEHPELFSDVDLPAHSAGLVVAD